MFFHIFLSLTIIKLIIIGIKKMNIDFKEGDHISFCEEHFLVVSNEGDSGQVQECDIDGVVFSDSLQLRLFWLFEGESCNLVKSAEK